MFVYALLCLLATVASALVQSPSFEFNVTSPVPGSPFVVGQKIPLIYDVSANATGSNLQLSVSLVQTSNATNSQVMVASADISQGFSFQKTNDGGATVYEHQYNYNIPTTTAPGNYQVVFADAVSQTNVTIAVSVNAAQSSTPSSTAASANPTAGSGGSIFNQSAAAQLRPLDPFALITACFVVLSIC